MTRLLRRAVQDSPPGAPDELRVVYRGVVVKLGPRRPRLGAPDVHRRAGGPVNLAYPRAADALLGALWNRFTEIGGLDDAPGTTRAEFTGHVRDERDFVEFLRAWWPVRRPADVLRSLGDPARLRRAAGRSLHRPADAEPGRVLAGGPGPTSTSRCSTRSAPSSARRRGRRAGAGARPRTRSSSTASTSSPASRSRSKTSPSCAR